MELSDIVKILIQHKDEVNAELAQFYKALGERDEKEAWKHLVITLHKAGSGLKVCNGHLEGIKTDLEKRGIPVKSQEELIRGEIIVSDDMQEEVVSQGDIQVKLRVKSPMKLLAIPTKQHLN